jgi:hypothetical protein
LTHSDRTFTPFNKETTMTAVRPILLALCLSLGARAQTLAINEFLASNNACCTDEHGDHDDWVELYNYGSEPVDLAGLWFSDHAGESGTQIPDDDDEITTVAPGGFIVVWFDEEPDQGLLHVDSKLSAGGESIIVYMEDGSPSWCATISAPRPRTSPRAVCRTAAASSSAWTHRHLAPRTEARRWPGP